MTPRRSSWTFRLALLSVAFLVGWSLLAFVQAIFDVRLPGLPRDETMLLAIIPIFAVAVGFAIVDLMSNTRIVAENALGETGTEPGWGRDLRRWTGWFFVGVLVLAVSTAGLAKRFDHRARANHRALVEEKAGTILAASQPLLDSLRVDTVTITRFRSIVGTLRFVTNSYRELGDVALVLPCGVPGRPTLCRIDGNSRLPDDQENWVPPPSDPEPIVTRGYEDACDGEGCLGVRRTVRRAGKGEGNPVVPDPSPRWTPPPEPRVELLLHPLEIELDLRRRLEDGLAASAPGEIVEGDDPTGMLQVYLPLTLHGVRVYLALELR